LPILADSGYEGAGADVQGPVKKPVHGELDTGTKTRNALLRSLRYQGERGLGLMSQRWRVLQRVLRSLTTIGRYHKIHARPRQFEHKMISSKSLRNLNAACDEGLRMLRVLFYRVTL
jgi:hypothetical protein